MTGSVVGHLVSKDWRLHRLQIILSLAGGAAALALVQVKREVPVVLGAVWFFLALILLGCFLPSTCVVNERKKQNLAFMMSLPVSPMQYTWSKVVSTFGMYLVPWVALVAAALSLIVTIGIPRGFIPMLLMLAGLALVGFSLIAGVAIVGESEGWYQLAVVVCNSSYGIAYYLISRVPQINHDISGPVAVWRPAVLALLAGELVGVVLVLGLTFFLQSRKRDFI
ncbi:MAG: ABC transporter permease [Bryobacteraceae bacterium]